MPWTMRKLIQHAESAIEAQKGQMQTGDGPMVNVPAYDLLNLVRRSQLIEHERQNPADSRVDEMAALIGRLVRSLRNAAPDNLLAEQALDYLKRNELLGSPLRS